MASPFLELKVSQGQFSLCTAVQTIAKYVCVNLSGFCQAMGTREQLNHTHAGPPFYVGPN